MNIRIAALALVGATVCGECPAEDFLHISHVHRGGKLERPDNTLETFKWCWENGSALECDCRRTKDGVGIMLHDDRLKRTARGISDELAGKSVSKELMWDEIKDVDVGSYIDPKFAHHRIPTIEAVFAAMKGHPTYLCFVDEKGAGPEYIAKKAVEAGVQEQVYYTGPSHEKIFAWQKVLPGGKAMIWLGAWPKDHGAAERARADEWFRDAMAKLRAKDFKYIDVVSIHTYYDPKDPVDSFIPSTPLLREMVVEFHARSIKVASIPFLGGETEEGRDADGAKQPCTLEFVVDQVDESGAITAWGGTDPVKLPSGEEYRELCKRMNKSGELPENVSIVRLHRTFYPGERSVNATQLNGADVLDPAVLGRAEVELRGQIDKCVAFLRKHVPGYEKCRVKSSAGTLGVRETRRVMGDTMVIDDDLLEGRVYPDAVVHQAWFLIDIHNPKGGGQAEGHSHPCKPYDIRYGSFLPKGVDGLLTAGRCISGTHRAHASYRVMTPCMAMGEAVGVAAALSVRGGKMPRQVAASEIRKVLAERGVELG